MKLICSECGEVHSAGCPIPDDATCYALCVSAGNPLNFYYISKRTIHQYVKLVCPRCGENTVTIIDSPPASPKSYYQRIKELLKWNR